MHIKLTYKSPILAGATQPLTADQHGIQEVYCDTKNHMTSHHRVHTSAHNVTNIHMSLSQSTLTTSCPRHRLPQGRGPVGDVAATPPATRRRIGMATAKTSEALAVLLSGKKTSSSAAQDALEALIAAPAGSLPLSTMVEPLTKLFVRPGAPMKIMATHVLISLCCNVQGT